MIKNRVKEVPTSHQANLAIELYQDGGYHEFIYSEDGYNLKIKCGNFIMPVIQLPPYIEGNDDNNEAL